MNSPFLMDSVKATRPTHPLNGRGSLSVIKVFGQCFLRLKKTFTLWHEMIEFNEFSVLLLELNSPNHLEVKINIILLKCITLTSKYTSI